MGKCIPHPRIVQGVYPDYKEYAENDEEEFHLNELITNNPPITEVVTTERKNEAKATMLINRSVSLMSEKTPSTAPDPAMRT